MKATGIITSNKREVETLNEIKEIRKALNNVGKIKAGKLKGHPVEELLNKI